MGGQLSKPARTAPARFVAKQLPRAPKDVETEFKKAKLTIEGLNKLKQEAQARPEPYVETKLTQESTAQVDHAAPRWYLNTWMEMMDNKREDRCIISGNLPIAWERDRFEPYSLVRNRIDDEDLDWLLSPEALAMKREDLVECTKLERQVLEDILASVEAPRRQYRNYQGKLHKAIEDENEFLTDRKKRMEESREEDVLRAIGYSDAEIKDEKQYLTSRSRGVKTLDDLGATFREKKRKTRIAVANEMEGMIDARKRFEIEKGEYKPQLDDLRRDDRAPAMPRTNNRNRRVHKNQFMLDIGQGDEIEKIKWWQDRRRDVEYGPDVIHDVAKYAEHLSQTEEQAKTAMDRSASLSRGMAIAQGAKGFFDPRLQYEEMLKLMRAQGVKEGDQKPAAAATATPWVDPAQPGSAVPAPGPAAGAAAAAATPPTPAARPGPPGDGPPA